MKDEVRLLFHELAGLSQDERERALARRQIEPEIRAEVESLFYHDSPSAHGFTACIGGAAERLLRATALPAALHCGPYRLVRLLGRGGMGDVYLGERSDGEIQQTVAVKLLSAAAGRPDWRDRFLKERQLLASLSHPSVVRVMDAGHTDDGQPFLVMEYVEGRPIDVVAAQLPLRDRLTLFLRVCEGVSHAHGRLIIHRDLKPSNILVDQSGQPKLLDFGIAKLLAETRDATQTAERILTPNYASPEQLRGEVQTTSTDIYSLGAVLYKLLTGRSPHESDAHASNEMDVIAGTRGIRAPSLLNPDVPIDLDYIVRKALRTEPEERYVSVEHLSEDIRRYLVGLPVTARKDTFGYRAAKFIRRHKTASVAAAFIGVSLVAGMGTTMWEAHFARLERARAESRFKEVRQLAGSVIFDLQNKLARLPGTTEVRKELVGTALGYLDRLAKEAYGDAKLQKELAEAYIRIGEIQGGGRQNLGDRQGANESFQKAERIARQMVEDNRSREARILLVDVLYGEGEIYLRADDIAKVEVRAKEALQIAREVAHSGAEEDNAQSSLSKALWLMGMVTNGESRLAYLAEAARANEALLSRKPDDQDRQKSVASIEKYIAAIFYPRDPDRAFEHLKRAAELDEQRIKKSPNDPIAKLDWAIDLSQWADYYEMKKDLPKAIDFTRRSLALRREIAAANPKDAWARDRLAYILQRLGGFQLTASADQALASYKEALAIGGDSRTRADSFAGVGEAYRKLGNELAACAAYAEARKLYLELLKTPIKPYIESDAAHVEEASADCSIR